MYWLQRVWTEPAEELLATLPERASVRDRIGDEDCSASENVDSSIFNRHGAVQRGVESAALALGSVCGGCAERPQKLSF